jgi:hypothetical protein
MSAEDLMRQAGTVAEKLRNARDASRHGRTTDAHEVATLEARLAGIWTAIRAARATGTPSPDDHPERRTRPKWDAVPPRDRRR